MVGQILCFLFREDPLFDPADWLPPLELEDDLVGVEGFSKVEENVTLDGVACEVKRLVDLDKGHRHFWYEIWRILVKKILE